MDALAGLLEGPRAHGAFMIRACFDPPWCVRVEDRAPLSVMLMVRGESWTVPDSGDPVLIRPGDLAIACGPDPYTCADDPAKPPRVVVLPGGACATPDGRCLEGTMDLAVRTWGDSVDGSGVMLRDVTGRSARSPARSATAARSPCPTPSNGCTESAPRSIAPGRRSLGWVEVGEPDETRAPPGGGPGRVHGGRGRVDGAWPASAYRERPARLGGAVVWTRSPTPGDTSPVLPDGCMDLIWTRGRLFVAGPDTRAHRPGPPDGDRYVGVRFFSGTAPALLGVPAHELRDRRVDLADLWPGARTRRLMERVDAAPDPAAALEALALRLAADAEPFDPLLRAIVVSLNGGRSVAATAEAVGLGARQLHRRSLDAFGYGPKTLARVLRLQRALALARDGVPFAETAALAGFADQAHLARDIRELAGAPLGELIGR